MNPELPDPVTLPVEPSAIEPQPTPEVLDEAGVEAVAEAATEVADEANRGAAGAKSVDVAAELKALFPGLFSGRPKPVKLRIQADIQERAPGRFTKTQLSNFLRRHTGSTGYLIALTQAKTRFDLDGQPAGELSEEHLGVAKEELARRRGVQQERVELDAQQRRNRAQLLWDFERTTLTEGNFCVLKGVVAEELPGLLEIARRERSEAPPMPAREARPAPRHDDRRPARREGQAGRPPQSRR